MKKHIRHLNLSILKKLTFSTIALLFCTGVFAKEQFIFTRISQEEGLTATINCIYKEKDSDVWIGSPNGMYRFDGYTLHQYKEELFSGCRIFQIFKDRKGNLWVLTDKKLLCRACGEENFSVILPDGKTDPFQFFSAIEDNEGVWFGGMSKIFRFDYTDGKLSIFSEMKDRKSFDCSHINFLDGRTLICSSHNGIIAFDTITGEFSSTPYGSDRLISCSMIDSKGRVWISSFNQGIDIFEKDGTKIKSFRKETSDLSNNIILCMTERNSVVWCGTDGGGITTIDLDGNNIEVLSHVSGDLTSFPANSIKSIHIDDYGDIWAGSIRDGLISVRSSHMYTFKDVHIGQSSGLSNPTVRCLHQEPDSDYVWIGTDGEGINRFNPKDRRFTHYPSTLSNRLVSIATYSDTELALSFYAQGIHLFNKQTGKIRPLKIDDEELNYQIRYSGRSINLYNERSGTLLLIGNKVKRFDKTNGRCTKIAIKDGDRAQGNFFPIGTTDNGVWIHDSRNIFFIPEGSPTMQLKGRLTVTEIRCGCLGPEGIIWLATGNGIYSFNTDESEFRHIETSLFKQASSVAWDGKSTLWVGTERYLYAYIASSGAFAIFGASDGAAENEYLSKSKLISSNGDIYLGGVQGLLQIGSEYEITESEDPAIKLNKLKADEEEVTPDKKGIYKVHRSCKTMSLSISIHEKDIFRQKRYRYQISSDNPAIETSSPLLNIRQLPHPGSYDIKVSCSKRNGDWSDMTKILTLKVPQPWYLTWWFITISCLIVLLSFYLILRTLSIRKENQMKLALKENEQKMYEEKVAMLINISHELRTPLTLIIAPLKRLLESMSPEQPGFNTLSRIYRQSRRMRRLLDMVLDLRKMEVGKSSLKIEKIDFNEWISAIVEDILKEEKEVGINIVLKSDKSITTVDFDRHKLETVIMNILMNAIKHSKSGDTISIITELTDDRTVRISISDQGPGLGDADLNSLFTRFYQSRSEEYGSGIGLSYSKVLVELHGGRIGAENNVDKGATFWWEIPVESPSENKAYIPGRAYLNEIMGHGETSEANVAAAEKFDTRGLKLMLVDDSQDLLDFLKEAFSGDFDEVVTVTSGHQAFRKLSESKLPDIIISDINMTDGDGYWLCNEIKQNNKYKHIPIVLLTAKGEEQSQSDSYKLGADSFLAKPFEIETLMELMRGILKRREEIHKRYLDPENKTSDKYSSDKEKFILELNSIISEHIGDPDLDQQLICRLMGISRAALYNKMKSITGTGAKEYITKIRIEKAKGMIEEGRMSLGEIAEKTGFSSASHFSTAFKSYSGMTPRQYKQSIEDNQEK